MKMILLNWGGCDGNGRRPLAPMPTVPSPTPPWKRPAESPLTNSIYGDGTISLQFDTTYLDSTAIRTIGTPPNDVLSPYQITLPNGQFMRQIVRIYIPAKNLTPFTTAQFNVLGNFSGFTSLTLGNLATSNGALLEWTGAWTLLGGGAQVIP